MDTFIIDALASWRLARLLTEDTLPVIKKSREWIWRRFPPVGHYLDDDDWKLAGQETAYRWWKLFGVNHCTEVRVNAHGTQAIVVEAHPIGELIGCPHCVGVWLAFGVAGMRRFLPGFWDPMAKILATAAVTSIVAETT